MNNQNNLSNSNTAIKLTNDLVVANQNLKHLQKTQKHNTPCIDDIKAIFCLDLERFEINDAEDDSNVDTMAGKIKNYATGLAGRFEIIKDVRFQMHKSIIDYSNNFYEIIKLIKEQDEPVTLLISELSDINKVASIFYEIKELVESGKLRLHCYRNFYRQRFDIRTGTEDYWTSLVEHTEKYFS